MKGTFIIVRKHDAKDYTIIRDMRDSYRDQRAFLKQFRGKHRHPEFAEVYPVKPTGRFRLAPARPPRPAAKPSLLQRAINALTPATEPAQPAPAEKTEPTAKPTAKRTTKKATGAFAQRVAAVATQG